MKWVVKIIVFLVCTTAAAASAQTAPTTGGVLCWDSVKAAAGYVVHYGQNSNALNFKFDAGGDTQCEISSLPHIDPLHPWYFAVSAYAFDAESELSSPVRWSGLSRTARLHWSGSPSPDVIEYRAYMADGTGSYGETPIYAGPAKSCDTPLLTGGGTYKFKILAVDAAGNQSTLVEIEKTVDGPAAILPADTTAPAPVSNIILIVE
jgi:hypothetical protein